MCTKIENRNIMDVNFDLSAILSQRTRLKKFGRFFWVIWTHKGVSLVQLLLQVQHLRLVSCALASSIPRRVRYSCSMRVLFARGLSILKIKLLSLGVSVVGNPLLIQPRQASRLVVRDHRYCSSCRNNQVGRCIQHQLQTVSTTDLPLHIV
jgi:hypothetical protein